MSSPRSPRQYQHNAVAQVRDHWAADRKSVLVVGPVGSGKCLGPETEVLFHNGTIKQAQDVVVGDLLQGPAGPRQVLATNKGFGELFKIKPVKGDPWVCNDVHILTLVDSVSSKVYDIALNQFLQRAQYVQNEQKLFFPREGVDFSQVEACTIDPYFLGLWFGDGTKLLANVGITKPDQEVIATCRTIAQAWGLRVSTYQQPGKCPTHVIVGQKNVKNPLLQELRRLVGADRTIPLAVIAGSRETRKQFLAGILDADGHLSRGGYDFAQKRRDYAQAVVQIARSLGIRAITPTPKVVNGTTYWRVSISGDVAQIPMRIERKKATLRLQKKNPCRSGFTVEAIGLGEYVGFTLDGDGRFLLGDFTVTHNTYVAEMLITKALQHDWAQVFYNANRETLVSQPAAKFQDAGIAHAFVKSGLDADAAVPLQFCQVQTMALRTIVPALDKQSRPYRRALVIWDEAHTIKAAQAMAIRAHLLQTFEFVYFCLFTATPYRLDGRGLSDVADALIEMATPQRLVDDGVLVSPLYWSTPAKPLDSDADDGVIFASPKIQGDIVATWQLRAQGLPTICRAYSIEHSKDLVTRFRAVGVRAAHIDGTMSTAQKRRLLVALAIGGRGSAHPLAVDILCAGSNIFDEGMDSRACYEMLLPKGAAALAALEQLRGTAERLPGTEVARLREVVLAGVLPELRDFYGDGWEPPPYAPLSVLIDAAPTASRGAWMQRQGRVVRSWPGKVVAIVLCHSGNLERHGYLLDHHGFDLTTDAAWSPRLRPATGVAALRCAAPVTCPGCLCVDRAGTVTCRNCGTVMVTPRLPDEDVAVELVQKSIETTPIAVSTPGTREAYLRSQYRKQVEGSRVAVAAGRAAWSTKWAAVRFKARYGHWPDGGLDRMIRREMGIRD